MTRTPTECTDSITRDGLARLAATLDAPEPTLVTPPLWHWTAFLDRTPHRHLGDEGHPRSGGFIEHPPYPRRMFAGGRLRVHTPVPIDRELTRQTQVSDVVRKDGRQGPLAFVTVTHTYLHDGESVAEEAQDLVYRPDPDERRSGRATGDTPASPSARSASVGATESGSTPAILRRCRVFDERQLFRFSALTFNAHRIHYDAPYARDIEGYPGLVVHGPLLIICLLELVREVVGDDAVAAVEFRALAPAFVHQNIELVAFQGQTTTDVRLLARRGDEKLMQANVELRDPVDQISSRS